MPLIASTLCGTPHPFYLRSAYVDPTNFRHKQVCSLCNNTRAVEAISTQRGTCSAARTEHVIRLGFVCVGWGGVYAVGVAMSLLGVIEPAYQGMGRRCLLIPVWGKNSVTVSVDDKEGVVCLSWQAGVRETLRASSNKPPLLFIDPQPAPTRKFLVNSGERCKYCSKRMAQKMCEHCTIGLLQIRAEKNQYCACHPCAFGVRSAADIYAAVHTRGCGGPGAAFDLPSATHQLESPAEKSMENWRHRFPCCPCCACWGISCDVRVLGVFGVRYVIGMPVAYGQRHADHKDARRGRGVGHGGTRGRG